MCPAIYTGSYGEHLETAPQHKIRPAPDVSVIRKPSSSNRRPSLPVTADEVAAELEAMAGRPKLEPGELPPDLVAEHERRLAAERARKQPAPEPAATSPPVEFVEVSPGVHLPRPNGTATDPPTPPEETSNAENEKRSDR
jgi:hypothetical protein